MSLLNVILILVLVQYFWFAFRTLVPMSAETIRVIAIIVLIVSILLLLWAFGVVPLFHFVR